MTYKELIVWQKADELAIEVYKVTKGFPKDEIYGLTSQLRRAVLSIPTNIVEGYARKGDKELARFVNIAIGSMTETEYLLDFSKRLGYISENEYNRIDEIRGEAGKLLWSFYKKIAVSLIACPLAGLPACMLVILLACLLIYEKLKSLARDLL